MLPSVMVIHVMIDANSMMIVDKHKYEKLLIEGWNDQALFVEISTAYFHM